MTWIQTRTGRAFDQPRLVSRYTWVARLERMEASYRKGRGGVPAGAVDALRVVGSVS